jgi:hypothetical protein
MDFLAIESLLPLASFGGLAAAVLGGILGNRADETFCTLCSHLTRRLGETEPPVNHDLQRAFRRAWLQASLLLAEPGREKGSRRLFGGDDALEPLRKAHRDELKRIGRDDYVPPATEADARLSLLLQPRGDTAAVRVAELRGMLEERYLAEAAAVLGAPPPAELTTRMREGWEERSAPGGGGRLTWWDALCAFFAQELKHNQVVANIFQGQILAELRVDGEPLTFEVFQGQLELHGRAVLTRLDSLQEAVAALGYRQAADAEAVRQRLDRLGEGMAVQEWLWEEVARSLHARASAGAAAYAELRRLIRERLDRNPPFRGRATQQEWLDSLLARPSGRLVVTAPAGFGKTALMAHWLDVLIERGYHVAYHFFDDHRDVTRSLEAGLAGLLGQVQDYHRLWDQEVPSRHDEVVLTLSRLIRNGGTPERPLVLLIDALDEAERPFSPPFPDELPAHVYVIVSARAGVGENPPYLDGWGDPADFRRLDRLSPQSVRDWLARAGDGELAEAAGDPGFVAAVEGATDGYPLYLKLLVDDLAQAARQGKDVRQLARSMPRGLTRYAAAELARLDRVDPSGHPTEGVRRCFTILASALGPLRVDELKELAEARDRDLRLLRQHPQVSRWLGADGEGPETAYRFAHPQLARAFREALGDEAEEAQERLLEWCAGWAEHRKPYALRHYAFHLRDAERWDDLTELFGNPDFFQAGEDSAFLRWYRFEDPAWQRLLCDWVMHRMNAPDRESARLTVATVYFDAHWWWGGFLPWPYTEELAGSLRGVSGWEQDPVLTALVVFHGAYPHVRDYRTRSLRPADWQTAAEALRTLRAALGLDGPLTTYAGDPHRLDRLRLRMLTGIYRAECAHYLEDPYAYRGYAEAAWLLRRREGGRLLLADDEWTLPWIAWQRAELWVARGCLRRAERACLRGLAQVDRTDAPEDWDWEVRSNLYRTLAGILDATDRLEEGRAAWELALALAWRFHSQPHPSPPDVYSLAFNALVREQWLDMLLSGPDDATERCAALRDLWRDWPAAPPDSGPEETAAALAAGEREALRKLLFPPDPEEGDPAFPQHLIRWFAPLEAGLRARARRLRGLEDRP